MKSQSAQIPVRSRAVAAVILAGRGEAARILVLQRNKNTSRGLWSLVMGRLEKDEKGGRGDPARDREETGIAVQALYTTGCVDTFFNSGANSIEMMPIFVALFDSAPAVTLDHEHLAFRWLSFAEAIEALAYPGQRDALPHQARFRRSRTTVPADPGRIARCFLRRRALLDCGGHQIHQANAHPLSLPAATAIPQAALAAEGKAPRCDLVMEPWERREAFLRLNPACETPVLTEDGLTLSGDYVITEYLEESYEEPAMLGRAKVERAEVRRLIAWFDGKFQREVTQHLLEEKVTKRLFGRGGPDSNALRAGKANIHVHLHYISWLIDRRNWLAGEEISRRPRRRRAISRASTISATCRGTSILSPRNGARAQVPPQLPPAAGRSLARHRIRRRIARTWISRPRHSNAQPSWQGLALPSWFDGQGRVVASKLVDGRAKHDHDGGGGRMEVLLALDVQLRDVLLRLVGDVGARHHLDDGQPVGARALDIAFGAAQVAALQQRRDGWARVSGRG